MRKLDPKCRKEPRADDANISHWNPTTFSLQVHRLGLQHMVAGGHMLVTSGKTGSVKLWPETMLRCLAHEAGKHAYGVSGDYCTSCAEAAGPCVCTIKYGMSAAVECV